MKYRNIAPKHIPARFTRVAPESTVTANGRKLFRRIDRKTEKPKILTFRAEYKYAKPPNTGNARNPIIFGKIPKPYIEQERRENAAVLYNSGLDNTNMARYQARVQSMNFRAPANSASIRVTVNLTEKE